MAKRFISSDLRESISIEESTTVHSGGEETVTWAEVTDGASVRVHVRVESENERVRAGRNEARESIVVTARKGIAIGPTNRFWWRDDVYQVIGFVRFLDARRLWRRFTGVRTDADALT